MPAPLDRDLAKHERCRNRAQSTVALYIEIQRFLFLERPACSIDATTRAWLALTTEDIHYRVTAAVARDAGVKAVDYAIIDENLVGLKSRIEQISKSALTRAENPPSLTRRVVSNIEAYHGRSSRANFLRLLPACLPEPSKRSRGWLLRRRETRMSFGRSIWIGVWHALGSARSHHAVRRGAQHAALRLLKRTSVTPDL